MSHLVSRILLATLLVPLAIVLEVFVIEILDESWPQDNEIHVASAITCAFMLAYWSLVWRKVVRWNWTRIGLTAGAVVPATVAAGIIGWYVGDKIIEPIGVLVGSFGGALIWMFATAFVWRETAGERAARYLDAAKAVS